MVIVSAPPTHGSLSTAGRRGILRAGLSPCARLVVSSSPRPVGARYRVRPTAGKRERRSQPEICLLFLKQQATTGGNALNEFIARYRDEIRGTLSGFDRLVFRGRHRALCGQSGIEQFFRSEGVLLKDAGRHVDRITATVKEAALARAHQEGRPVLYMRSAAASKEEVARRIAAADGIRSGLVCALTAVEPCLTWEIHRNRETRKLEGVPRARKCLHVYQYWMHPELGFLNARIQTWFPFSLQVCLNGREWLARRLDQLGMAYSRQDNCFPWVEDFPRAQALLDEQLQTNWVELLAALADELNPLHEEIFRRYRVQYYWSVYQSEWALDVVFRRAEFLRRLYPRLTRQALLGLGSGDILRFLGRRTEQGVPASFSGEVMTDLRRRQEGVRIKHFLNGNSVKAYDKAFTRIGSVLRLETTIQNEKDFRVFRPKEGDPDGALAWRPMRRGIADLYRRAEVSQRSNERYANALASVDDRQTLAELTSRLEERVLWKGERFRGLRLFASGDLRLLEAVARGEFAINGLRNRDLQRLLFPSGPVTPAERRRRSGWVGRRLRLLRAHGLLHKVPHTHRYQLSEAGRNAITAILAARQAVAAELINKAA